MPCKLAFTDNISADHPDPALATTLTMRALGITDVDFLETLTRQLAEISAQGSDLDEGALNAMLGIVKGIEPTDQVECMLAAQMATVHMATMKTGRRLLHAKNVLEQDSSERAFNKLARTFAAQIQALSRYRTGGEQKVTVEHVTVNEGGQAIVGNVAPERRGGSKKSRAST